MLGTSMIHNYLVELIFFKVVRLLNNLTTIIYFESNYTQLSQSDMILMTSSIISIHYFDLDYC